MADSKKRTSTPLVDLMFQAFCHRMRVRILHLLAQGEMCVCNIVEIVQAPQPKVSRHLGVLKRAKLVTVRREGQWIFYSVAPAQSTFHLKLLDCAANCVHEVTEIREDERRLEAMRSRENGCCVLSTRGSSKESKEASGECCESGR